MDRVFGFSMMYVVVCCMMYVCVHCDVASLSRSFLFIIITHAHATILQDSLTFFVESR